MRPFRNERHGYGERGGKGERYGESKMETYINICKIDSQWESIVYLRELKLVICINIEEWDWEGDGSKVQE